MARRARARSLLSTEDRIELLERKSDFARRNTIILRAIADPENGVGSLLTLDAIESWEPPLLPAVHAAALCFGADALPAIARRLRELPEVALIESHHVTPARLGTVAARQAVRELSVGGRAPKEFFSEMVLLAMDLRDPERAKVIVDALAADPVARLHFASGDDSVPEVDEIREALEEMVVLTGASAELDELAEEDVPWISSVSGPELGRAREWLSGLPPPGAARGEHHDPCGPGCGHSHHAPLRPLHAEEKIGRNDLCPCGSGKKHKRCCGK